MLTTGLDRGSAEDTTGEEARMLITGLDRQSTEDEEEDEGGDG